MATRDHIQWFKTTFHEQIAAAVAGTPFSVDLLVALATQETGEIWGPRRNKLPLATLLEICTGDTIDAKGDKGRRAFPKDKAELLAWPRGDAMFAVARAALVTMAQHVPAYAPIVNNPDKFCHGFGVFQYDIQFFKTDPDYFLNREWRHFDRSLARAVEELRAAQKRIPGLKGNKTLADDEQVHVAIAYNAGSFKPQKGLQQGFKSGDGKFYGEMIFQYLKLSQEIAVGAASVTPAKPAVSKPAPQLLEVNVTSSPLRLRSAPKLDPANIIGQLADGQLVRFVSGKPGDQFTEIETKLNGRTVRGFAASQYLVPSETPAD